MGRRGIRGLKTRVWRECSTSRGWARLNSAGIQVGGESHSVTSRDAARRAAPRVGAAKTSEFGEEKL